MLIKLTFYTEKLQNYLLDKWVIASAVLLVVFIIFIVCIAMKIIKKQRGRNICENVLQKIYEKLF